MHSSDHATSVYQQRAAWAAPLPAPLLLPHPGLHVWPSTLCSGGWWLCHRWVRVPANRPETRPPPEHTLLLLQRMGQLGVAHLELRHRQQHGQRSHQPHQLRGQLLHRRQRTPSTPAGRSGGDHECSLSVRWAEEERLLLADAYHKECNYFVCLRGYEGACAIMRLIDVFFNSLKNNQLFCLFLCKIWFF